ncbi:MAG TPA: hypothetical protein VNJ08_02380 [Bacteriovoracaceae bacterium]|nr:hypothetical protein [Bacteriovoracaceae bacterium]
MIFIPFVITSTGGGNPLHPDEVTPTPAKLRTILPSPEVTQAILIIQPHFIQMK